MKMPRVIFSSAMAAVLVPHAPVHAQKALVLEPSSPWAVDYAEERCSLVRVFGDEKQSFSLRIDAYSPKNQFRTLMVSNLIPAINTTVIKFERSFSPDTQERDGVEGITGIIGDKRAVSSGIHFEPVDRPFVDDTELGESAAPTAVKAYIESVAEFEAAVKSITVDFPKRGPIELKTGSMAKPLQSLRTCTDDLVKTWGLDAARYHGQTRSAGLAPGEMERIKLSYPTFMLEDGISAYVPLRVMVDENGDATKCVVQVEVGSEKFRQSICNIFMRRYSPALDSAGKPVASVFQTSIQFQL